MVYIDKIPSSCRLNQQINIFEFYFGIYLRIVTATGQLIEILIGIEYTLTLHIVMDYFYSLFSLTMAQEIQHRYCHVQKAN